MSQATNLEGNTHTRIYTRAHTLTRTSEAPDENKVLLPDYNLFAAQAVSLFRPLVC